MSNNRDGGIAQGLGRYDGTDGEQINTNIRQSVYQSARRGPPKATALYATATTTTQSNTYTARYEFYLPGLLQHEKAPARRRLLLVFFSSASC